MRDIADEAGVSAQTVYDSVGSKRVLVGPLSDLIDAEAGIRELAASIDAAENSRDILVTQAAITRSILEHCGDIVVALLSGSDAEHELQQVLAEGRRRHLADARTVIDAVVARDALAPDLQPDQAAESLAAISDIGVNDPPPPTSGPMTESKNGSQTRPPLYFCAKPHDHQPSARRPHRTTINEIR